MKEQDAGKVLRSTFHIETDGVDSTNDFLVVIGLIPNLWVPMVMYWIWEQKGPLSGNLGNLCEDSRNARLYYPHVQSPLPPFSCCGPEQLNSFFWISATLRPRREAGPAHCVNSPMVGRWRSHWESQPKWQSQNSWLECKRLEGGKNREKKAKEVNCHPLT